MNYTVEKREHSAFCSSMPGRTARFSSDLRLLVEKECMIIELQPLYKSRRLHVYQQGKLIEKNDPVVIETQLHLIVNDEPAAELVCSPQAFAELAVGYLLSENLLKDYPDLCSWRLDAQQQAIHLYTKHSWLGQAQHTRQINSYAGRGLGLQTETTGIAAVTSAKDLFTPAQIFAMIDALENSGGTFHLTGGTHNAGLGYQGQLLSILRILVAITLLTRCLAMLFSSRFRSTTSAGAERADCFGNPVKSSPPEHRSGSIPFSRYRTGDRSGRSIGDYLGRLYPR
jgi:hypothetical protein